MTGCAGIATTVAVVECILVHNALSMLMAVETRVSKVGQAAGDLPIVFVFPARGIDN